jgi:hypothetical protein
MDHSNGKGTTIYAAACTYSTRFLMERRINPHRVGVYTFRDHGLD